MEEGGFFFEAGEFEDAGGEVEDGVDAGELVEESDEKGEEDGSFESCAPEAAGAGRFVRGGGDFVGLGLDIGIGGGRVDQFKNGDAAGAIVFASDEPSWAFGQAEAHETVDEGGDGFDAEHPAPGVFADATEERV